MYSLVLQIFIYGFRYLNNFENSYGAHVISAMATEIKETGLGQIDRLTLLDPGIKVSKYKVDGKTQKGLIHKVDAGMMYKTTMCLHLI